MKTKYTIHDVAALLGISTDAIRLYEKEGLVSPLRDPKNGYRYYEYDQIHRIMGISLYRQLDVGIAEIRELLNDQTFPEVCTHFEDYIAQSEQEIIRLKNRMEKLKFMKTHLESLNEGLNTYELKTLPECYILYHQDHTERLYREIQKLITSPVFSFGNFCYVLQQEENKNFTSHELEFVIREPMIGLTPWGKDASSFPVRESCRCLYTVKCTLDHTSWNIQEMLHYTKEKGLKCSNKAYAFYVYSMLHEDSLGDYYEIYLPLEGNC